MGTTGLARMSMMSPGTQSETVDAGTPPAPAEVALALALASALMAAPLRICARRRPVTFAPKATATVQRDMVMPPFGLRLWATVAPHAQDSLSSLGILEQPDSRESGRPVRVSDIERLCPFRLRQGSGGHARERTACERRVGYGVMAAAPETRPPGPGPA